MSLSIDGQIQAVKREIAMRERVYPGLVVRNKMRQSAADYELAAMRDVLATPEGLLPPKPEGVEWQNMTKAIRFWSTAGY